MHLKLFFFKNHVIVCRRQFSSDYLEFNDKKSISVAFRIKSKSSSYIFEEFSSSQALGIVNTSGTGISKHISFLTHFPLYVNDIDYSEY